MSRKDRFHDLVKQALIQTGWKITDDPLYLSIGNVNIQIDLAAEPLIAATKDDRKIAVEVKSFISASQITDFYGALGQYLTYRVALKLQEPDSPRRGSANESCIWLYRNSPMISCFKKF
jgi:XisH protein